MKSTSLFTVLLLCVIALSGVIYAQEDDVRTATSNSGYQILAWQIGGSHTENVVGTAGNFRLSGTAGQTLASDGGASANYQLSSGFWAQVQALRTQTQIPVFRTIDGSENNVTNPDYGRVDTKLLRLAGAAYADGRSEPRGGGLATAATLPSGREISNIVVAQTEPLFNTLGASDMFWQWGQFLDHDIDLTEVAEPHEPFHILVPTDDPAFSGVITLTRSVYITDPNGVREQINQITAFPDASQVYGSDEDWAIWKRSELPDGTILADLKTSEGNLLPFEEGTTCSPDGSRECFGAGDIRANEQPGLTAMHTVFMREHNRIVGILRATNPEWDEDRLYETARLLVGSEMQRITYDEWLPLLLGADALPAYTGYNASINAGIANEFSTACFRFGHTMLSGSLRRLDANGQSIGDIALRDGFSNTSFILDDGIDPILRGLMAQQAQELDTQLVDDVRNFLFGAPGAGGFDLAALNIQRGRDHGLASYNDVRVALGLARAQSFADITSDADLQAKLVQAYSSVDEVDLWIGGLAEDAVNGGLLGETCSTVIADQFERLRDGDRFWHGNVNWTVYELAGDPVLHGDGTTLSAVTLADIIEWNSDVTVTQPNPFIAPVANQETLVIYAIAADNNPNSALSINAYTTALLETIEANTTFNKRAIILVDFDRHGDTTIHVSHNGETTPIIGLPASSGVLDGSLNEYDMSDGTQLGGFLKWALDTYADEQTQIIFEYIGHGTFVMPDGEYPTGDGSRMTYDVGANPGYTDMHPAPSVISPQDIRQMLEVGTNNGAISLDVLDLTHCFAGTIEELYELVNDGAPYTSVVIASPSYGYVSETLFGEALATIYMRDSALQTAQKILAAYDAALTATEEGTVAHPVLWTVVDLDQLGAVKPALDALSSILNVQLNSDAATTKAKLQQAQQNAHVYDTSFAQADWSLDDTDALVDVKSYMRQLRAVFGASSAVGLAAADVESAADAAILHTVRRSGVPYFAPDVAAWDFDTSERAGLALFAPFTAHTLPNSDQHIPWQWAHYVQTAQVGYPNPFALLEVSTAGSATWATIVQRYWEGESVIFSAELPQLSPMQQDGELHPVEIVLPAPRTVHRSTPASIAAIIHADRLLYGVQIHLQIFEDGERAFDEVVTIAELQEGDNFIESRGFWTPTGDDYVVRVSADSSNRIQEGDEEDNIIESNPYQIEQTPGVMITATEAVQLFRTRTVMFEVESDADITTGNANLYSFKTNEQNGRIRSSVLEASDLGFVVNNGIATLTLPEQVVSAGTYRLDIWGVMGGQLSANYQRVRFNFAPEAYTQSAERTFYRIQANANETLDFNLAVTDGTVRYYIWSPGTPRSAMMFDGNESYQVASAAQGTYVVMIERISSDATYTLNVWRNGAPIRVVSAEPQMVGMDRPIHVTRNITVPTITPTHVSLTAFTQTPFPVTPVLSLVTILLSLTVIIYHRNKGVDI